MSSQVGGCVFLGRVPGSHLEICKLIGEYSAREQLKNNSTQYSLRRPVDHSNEDEQHTINTSFNDVVDIKFAHLNDDILFQTVNIGSVRYLVVWNTRENTVLNATNFWSTAPSTFHSQPSCVVSNDNSQVALFVPPFPCFGGEECVLFSYHLIDNMKDLDLLQREHVGYEGENFVVWSLNDEVTRGATISYYVKGRDHDHAVYQLRMWDIRFKTRPREGKRGNTDKYLEWTIVYKLDLPEGHSWAIEGFVNFDFSRDKTHFSITTPSGLAVLYNGPNLLKIFPPANETEGPCMCLFYPQNHNRFILCYLHQGLCELWQITESQIHQEYAGRVVQLPTKINTMCFSSDGTLLAFGTSEGKVIVCRSHDLSQLQVINAPSTGLSTTSVTFSNSCEEVAAGYNDGVIRFWQLPLSLFSLQHMCRKVILKRVAVTELSSLPLSNSVLKYINAFCRGSIK